MSTYWLRPSSSGSSMPRPTETPAAPGRALVRGLHDARASAGDDRVPGLGQARGDLLSKLVFGAGPQRPGGAEDRHRYAQLREQAEALDELGLDPHDPPGIGMHPVGRAALVEQPLVRRGRRDLLASQGGRSLAAHPQAGREKRRPRCSLLSTTCVTVIAQFF